MGFSAKNMMNPLFILKFVELVFEFIVVMLYTCGPSQADMKWVGSWGDSISQINLGIFTCIGFFFITLILMIGMIMGDKAKISLILFNLIGFFCYIIAGSFAIQFYNSKIDVMGQEFPVFQGKYKSQGLAMGSMAIINACVLLVDAFFSFLELRKND